MKKLLIFALAAAIVLALSACGPKGDAENTLSTADGSVTSADIPEETLPTTADEPVTADTEPVTLPEEATTNDSDMSSETEASSDNAVTTSSDAATTPATTTTAAAATTTKASTTTAATTTATQKTTETAATTTTADPDEGFEEEELEWEVIENLDEWFISMGIETGDVNANG